jgi:hypothetical protein
MLLKDQCELADTTDVSQNILVATHGAWLASFLEFLIQSSSIYKLEDCDTALARKPAPTTGVTKIVISKKATDNGPRALQFLTLHDQSHLKGKELPN